MNFCNKIDIWSILQKCKFWYHWTNWTFVTDEYLKIRRSNLGEKIELFLQNKNSTNISKMQVLIWVNKLNFYNKMEFDQYHKNEGFDTSEQIELFIRWIFENWKLQYGWTKWTFVTK